MNYHYNGRQMASLYAMMHRYNIRQLYGKFSDRRIDDESLEECFCIEGLMLKHAAKEYIVEELIDACFFIRPLPYDARLTGAYEGIALTMLFKGPHALEGLPLDVIFVPPIVLQRAYGDSFVPLKPGNRAVYTDTTKTTLTRLTKDHAKRLTREELLALRSRFWKLPSNPASIKNDTLSNVYDSINLVYDKIDWAITGEEWVEIDLHRFNDANMDFDELATLMQRTHYSFDARTPYAYPDKWSPYYSLEEMEDIYLFIDTLKEYQIFHRMTSSIDTVNHLCLQGALVLYEFLNYIDEDVIMASVPTYDSPLVSALSMNGKLLHQESNTDEYDPIYRFVFLNDADGNITLARIVDDELAPSSEYIPFASLPLPKIDLSSLSKEYLLDLRQRLIQLYNTIEPHVHDPNDLQKPYLFSIYKFIECIEDQYNGIQSWLHISDLADCGLTFPECTQVLRAARYRI